MPQSFVGLSKTSNKDNQLITVLYKLFPQAQEDATKNDVAYFMYFQKVV